jgi:hypothetical protein
LNHDLPPDATVTGLLSGGETGTVDPRGFLGLWVYVGEYDEIEENLPQPSELRRKGAA